MQRRVEFAIKFKEMDWTRVMFTDSKIFHFNYQPTRRAPQVWCRKEDGPILPEYKKAKKVHVYAGLAVAGVTPLIFVQGTTGVPGLDATVNS